MSMNDTVPQIDKRLISHPAMNARLTPVHVFLLFVILQCPLLIFLVLRDSIRPWTFEKYIQRAKQERLIKQGLYEYEDEKKQQATELDLESALKTLQPSSHMTNTQKLEISTEDSISERLSALEDEHLRTTKPATYISMGQDTGLEDRPGALLFNLGEGHSLNANHEDSADRTCSVISLETKVRRAEQLLRSGRLN